MGKDLRCFLKAAREGGSSCYVEASRPLELKYEIGILQRKLAAERRFPVLYCPQIKGSRLPLVSNLLGSYGLLGMALDIPPRKLRTEGKIVVFQEYRRREKLRLRPVEIPRSRAPVQEVVYKGKDVDLRELPIPFHNELDSGRYISTGVMICKDPDSGSLNAGVYRRELKGKDQLGCMISPSQDAAHVIRRCAALGKPVETVTIIGHHPAVFMGAAMKLPRGECELELMGALLGEPLEVTPALTVDLPVPAFAEIAIEGVIDTSRMSQDGPFAEAFGYYGEERPCYVTQVTAITMRRDAIYHDLDPNHSEHILAGVLGRESVTFERVRGAVPTVKVVHCGPEERLGGNFTYVSIKKQAQGQGKLAGLAALSASQLCKVVVVVDDDVDVYNEQEVLWAIGTRVRSEQNISIIPGMPAFDFGPTSHGETGTGPGCLETKILIDATMPIGLPFTTRVTSPQALWESIQLEDYLR